MSKKKKEKDAPPEAFESDAESDAEAVEDQPVDLQTERDDLLDRLQRVSADYANFQKRAQREKDEARHFAHAEIIKTFLPVLDDMERALEAARDNHGEDDPLFKGMQIVHDKALDILGTFGLTPIDAVGKSFDPDRHAALMQQPSEDHPPQTVLQELQKGYVLGDRTIRPSGVVVSVEPPEDEAEPSADS